MNVYATIEPHRMSVVVYVQIGTDDSGDKMFMTAERDIVNVALGSEPPFFLRLPIEIAEKVGEALAPRQEASARHLDDAIGVRDRMIDFVEKHIDALTRQGG